MFLIIGTSISWIPWIPYLFAVIGAGAVVAGAVFLISGRAAFGPRHAQNVVVSIVLYVVGVLGEFALGFLFGISILAAPNPQLVGCGTTTAFVQTAFDRLMIGTVALAAISGLGAVFFTHALNRSVGRAILWVGYAATILVKVATYFIVQPAMAEAIERVFCYPPHDLGPILAVESLLGSSAVLMAIPAAAYCIAYALAVLRIFRREIPADESNR